MVLQGLQSLLARLYDINLDHNVHDFLLTDRRVLMELKSNDSQDACDEELLLAETADGVGVTLYLDKRLLRRLEQGNPLRTLTEKNLSDYCAALEGVSHFVYSTWRLNSDAPVSLLELETQAEVDKFAATVFLVAGQQGGEYPRHVHARLFDRVRFDERLDPEQFHRYRTAHRCAARYCQDLERRFVKRGQLHIEALLRELRKFYRLGCTAKLRYAAA